MKYIFFDIDGTLISHVKISHIPEETREAVNLLREAGHIPAIATGRAAFLALNAAKEFGINYLVASGGAQIVINNHEIHSQFFPDEHLNNFREVAAKFPEITACVDEKYLYTAGAFDLFREYFNNQAGYNCIRPLHEMKRAIMCYIMLNHEKLNNNHGLFFSPPENTRLELMHGFTESRHSSSTKWDGIKKLIAHEGANLDDVITFGDGPNDSEMLRNAKIGVAVGRASQEVKNFASYVCEDIDDGGILKACKHLGLI